MYYVFKNNHKFTKLSTGESGNSVRKVTHFTTNKTENGVTYVTLHPVDENDTNIYWLDSIYVKLENPFSQNESIFMKFVYIDDSNGRSCSERIDIGRYYHDHSDYYGFKMTRDRKKRNVENSENELESERHNHFEPTSNDNHRKRYRRSPGIDQPQITICGDDGMPTYGLLFNSSIYVKFYSNHSGQRRTKGFQFRYTVIPRNMIPDLSEVFQFYVIHHCTIYFIVKAGRY